MKRGTIWIVVSSLIVISLVLVSCSSSTTSTSTSKAPTIITTTNKDTIAPPITALSTTSTSTKPTTTSATGNWWDSLGKPQYGGTLTLRLAVNVAGFDPYFMSTAMSINPWWERLYQDDWTLNPSVFGYKLGYRPSDYVKGDLAESWSFTDPGTFVVHLRQGIHWQDIPPANGRELTADDVVFNYDRMYGLGSGMTPYPYADPRFKQLISVTASDKYTVVLKWSTPNPEFILELMETISGSQVVLNPEVVKLYGDANDWHHAVGTGPFIMKDFVSASSLTCVKNPNYWGYDERYPQNQLPYIDTLKILIIPDNATALAAMRTGKIDVMDGMSYTTAQQMQKSSPEILQISNPAGIALTVDMRNDHAPFTDIRVREAMQIAIDLPTIAKTYYYDTCPPYPTSMTTRYMTGWGFPYEQWPQDLKDQYAYNPTQAKALLASAGYPNGFKTNIAADTASDLDLLQIIKSYWAAVGIDMEIRTMDSVSLIAFVQNQKKYDQLGYRVNGSMGSSSEPIKELALFVTGASTNFQLISDPVVDSNYTKAMAATSVDQVKQILKDENEYFSRQHFTVALLHPSFFAFYQPWLIGYNGASSALPGTGSGPPLLYFYAARFWIKH